MPKVTYIEHNGMKHEVELESGVTVMRGALNNGIPGIDGDCGGECACATCHVFVDPNWLDKLNPINEMEMSLLSFAALAQSNSRLSCQIAMSPELDGLIVTLPDGQH